MSVLRIAALAGLAAAYGLTLPGIANAETVTTVEVVSDRLVVRAGVGQSNEIVIRLSGSNILVSDTGPARPGNGCTSVTGTIVACPGRLARADVSLGDGDDRMSVDPAVVMDITTSGGDGDDTIDGGTGTDWLHGGAGVDTLHGGLGADHLFGDDDADYLYGEQGSDELRGGHGSDYLTGGTETDVIDGTDGMRDVVLYTERTKPVTVNLGTGNGGEAGENDTIQHVQDVGTGSGKDSLTGDANHNTLDGGAGDDVIKGGDGKDSLYGATGDDDLFGEGGADHLEGGDNSAVGDDCFPGGQAGDMVGTCEIVG